MLLLLNCSLMVQTKRNQEKVVVTTICFYVSAKTEWKIKVCVRYKTRVLSPRWSKWGVRTAMLTSKLYFLLNISWLHVDGFSWNFYSRDSFDQTIKMRDQPYAKFKTACFVNYLVSLLTDVHETSKTGILLMRWLKWRVTSPMLTSKLHVLLNILAPCWWIFIRLP